MIPMSSDDAAPVDNVGGGDVVGRSAEDAVIDLFGDDPLVRVEGLKKHFGQSSGFFGDEEPVRAVDGVDFAIPEGETFGLVGESGSGKTTTGKSLLRIIEPTAGTVEVMDEDVTAMTTRQLKSYRKNMQMVFQDPTSSLNPRKRVRDIIKEPMVIHDYLTKRERVERVEELLDIVGLPQDYKYKYPNSLSGGQKQRVGIARAVALNPEFVVLDEPTSALDVSVQARIVDLFDDLQNRLDLTYLFITHDLCLVKNVSDWIGVMYLGQLVEVGRTEDVFKNPQHPYTRALLSTIATMSQEDEKLKPKRVELRGEIPDPRDRPSGCGFRTRCPYEFAPCSDVEPPLYRISDSHLARCLLHDPEEKSAGPDW
jgi:oligopeptide transport system ATP-binding protein